MDASRFANLAGRERLASFVAFIKFSLIGGVGLLVNLTVVYIFKEFLDFWYFFAFIIGTLANWTFNFFANSLITFRGHAKEKYFRKYTTFLLIYGCAFVINSALVYTMTSIFSIYYLASITMAAFVTAVLNFILIKKIVFK